MIPGGLATLILELFGLAEACEGVAQRELDVHPGLEARDGDKAVSLCHIVGRADKVVGYCATERMLSAVVKRSREHLLG